jgi:TPR repeat protein
VHYLLSLACVHRAGGAHDFVEAARLFGLAAAQGHAGAQRAPPRLGAL